MMSDDIPTQNQYAEVVVNRPIFNRHKSPAKSQVTGKAKLVIESQANTRLKTFHYHIPNPLLDVLQPGHLVAVPFRHQVLQAVVVAISPTSPVQKTRAVQSLLDPDPILQPNQLALAQWLAKEYLAPLTTCVNYFLPPGTSRQPQTIIEPITNVPLPADLTPLERALHLYLQQQTKPTALEDVETKVADGLVKKGLARRRTTLSKPKVGPRIERTVELIILPEEIDDALLTLGRSTKQAEILQHLSTLDDPLPTIESVLATVGCTESPLKALIEKTWLTRHPKQHLLALLPHQTNLNDAIPAHLRNAIEQLHNAQTPLSADALQLSNEALTELKQLEAVGVIEEPDRVSLNLDPVVVPAAISDLRGTGRHAQVLQLLAQEDGPVWAGWIYAQSDATSKTLQDLAKADLIAFDEERHWRDPLASRTFTLSQPPPLNTEQQEIWGEIQAALNQHGKPFLLHGVTGSGKTEIYLRAITQILAEKKQAIFMVPEVMLATQIVERVQARFPDQVALWHSSLSPGERFDTWERVRSGDLPIVVGPRSALFAPVRQPGLIVIDEEHEPAYKQQDRAPTFHLREAAIEYGRLNDIPVIMGSATPDLVSFRKAQRGQYRLLSLPNRILAHRKHLAVQAALLKQARKTPTVQVLDNGDFVALPMPPVEVVDLRDELRAGNRSIFSRALTEAIRQTLAAGEQVIIFLNRRGTATFVNCRDCGHVVDCPRCDSNLTYHAPGEQLVCHYCGYRENNPERCPVCNSSRIRYFGLGTERVEAALRRTFPEAKPLRFDQDTTRKPGSHYTFLQHFVEGRANVMIGTQMVAKGLDLPLVTLVGVISADTALYLPDFRSAERTFQVLTQVAGRAGRSPLGGRVIVQTYTPDHPAIIAASQHDYIGFYNEELYFRYEQGYPPFKRLARLRYSGSGYQQSRQAAQDMVDKLKLWVDQQGFPAVDIIGPTPMYIQRLRSKYRWQIVINAANPAEILGPVALPVGWQIDIDPVSLL